MAGKMKKRKTRAEDDKLNQSCLVSWPIDDILDDRMVGEVKQYLVKWGDVDKDEPATWLPEWRLDNCEHLIEEYKKKSRIPSTKDTLRRIQEGTLAPSSSRLDWLVLASMLNTVEPQTLWAENVDKFSGDNNSYTLLTEGLQFLKRIKEKKLICEIGRHEFNHYPKIEYLFMDLIDNINNILQLSEGLLTISRQFKVQGGYTDYALCYYHTNGETIRTILPIIVYEVKLSVHSLLSSVDSQHLAQVFVQSYYCLKFKNSRNVLGILTDAGIYHIFMVQECPNEVSGEPKLKVAWYHQSKATLDRLPELSVLEDLVQIFVKCLTKTSSGVELSQ